MAQSQIAYFELRVLSSGIFYPEDDDPLVESNLPQTLRWARVTFIRKATTSNPDCSTGHEMWYELAATVGTKSCTASSKNHN